MVFVKKNVNLHVPDKLHSGWLQLPLPERPSSGVGGHHPLAWVPLSGLIRGPYSVTTARWWRGPCRRACLLPCSSLLFLHKKNAVACWHVFLVGPIFPRGALALLYVPSYTIWFPFLGLGIEVWAWNIAPAVWDVPDLPGPFSSKSLHCSPFTAVSCLYTTLCGPHFFT